MKEHFQDYGARKWAGDDLIELQSEPLAALQALVSPYAPGIVSGCETRADDGGGYTVSAGLVALPGKDVKGNDCVKIVRTDSIAMADNNQVCYLTLQHQTLTRTYGDGTSKAIAYNYVAQQTTIKPEDTPYLEIAANGGQRLVDTLGITQKLDREGGDATDVKVTFADPSADQEPEPLKSNTKLGTLISQIKGWLSVLKKELGNKVDKEKDKVLSTNDFTNALKNKLDGIDDNANNFTYAHPTGNGNNHIPAGGKEGQYLKYSESGTATWAKPTASEIGAATTAVATTSANGLMSAADKAKLNGIESNANKYTHPSHTAKASGLYKITVDSSGHVSATSAVTKTDITNLGIPGQDTNTVYTHPTTAGNKHIPTGGSSGKYLKWSSSGTAVWNPIETVNILGNKSSCTVSLSPGDLVRISNDSVTISVAAATLEQLSKNNVAYVSNSAWMVSRITAESGMTLVISDSSKSVIGTTQMGLWRITWHGKEAAFVEFIKCDEYIYHDKNDRI